MKLALLLLFLTACAGESTPAPWHAMNVGCRWTGLGYRDCNSNQR
jgi:hypothetical protein